METTNRKKSKISLKRFLKSLDYFGVDIKFQINDDETYQSVFGGVAYLMFFLVSLVYFLINFNDFVNRKNLKLIITEEIKKTSPALNLEQVKLGVAVGLKSTNQTIEQEFYKYLDLQVNFVKLKKSGNRYKSPVKIEACKIDHFYNQNNDQFEYLNLKNYFCPQFSNFTMQGIFSDDEFNYFEIFAIIKKNLNEDDLNYVQNLFFDNSINAEIFYLDTSVILYNLTHPTQKFINSQFIKLGWEFSKSMNVDFSELNFISDENLLFNSDYTLKNVVLSNIWEYFEFVGLSRENKRNGNFFKIYLRSSNKIKTVKRTFQKFTEFLADTSSLISIGILVLYYVIHQLNNFKAKQSVVKRISKMRNNFLKIDFNEKNSMDLTNYKSAKEIFTNGKKILNLNEDDRTRNFFEVSKESNIFPSRNPLFLNSARKLQVSPDKSSEREKIVSSDFKQPEINLENSEIQADFQKENFSLKKKTRKSKPKKSIKQINKQGTNEKIKKSENVENKMSNEIKINMVKRNSIQLENKLNMKNNICEILMKYIFFCCSTKKNKLKQEYYRKGHEKIHYHMDIINFIRKMEEVDFLKYLLLNEDQLKIFYYISRQSLLENFHQDKTNSAWGIDDFLKSYENLISEKSCKSSVNRRLIELFHSEIKRA